MDKIYDVEDVENICKNVPPKHQAGVTKLTLKIMKHDAYARP